eukprot:765523-Hanusia_phi.AAC.7
MVWGRGRETRKEGREEIRSERCRGNEETLKYGATSRGRLWSTEGWGMMCLTGKREMWVRRKSQDVFDDMSYSANLRFYPAMQQRNRQTKMRWK